MSASITIVEVLRRSTQGATKPFLCRGDDGRLFYVKGRYAGQRSLCCEWVASSLAREVGLAVPDFAIAEIPRKLVQGSDREDIGDLGDGQAFASAALDGAQEITWEVAGVVSQKEKRSILAFDWWVHNEDRSLSARGGNPNLLITQDRTELGGDLEDESGGVEANLWAFDFNLAFDSDFNAAKFWNNHVFARERMGWQRLFVDEMADKMKRALNRFPEIWAELPEEWLYLDGDDNLPMQLEFDMVKEILWRPFKNAATFWQQA